MTVLRLVHEFFNRIIKLIDDFSRYITDRKKKKRATVYEMIAIDSAYRNRLMYPLLSDFVVPFNNFNKFETVLDPVCNSYPINVGNCIANGSNITAYLSVKSQKITNFYINKYIIMFSGDSSMINTYSSTTFLATFSPPFVHDVTNIGDTYVISKQLPKFQGTATYSGIKKVILSHNFGCGIWTDPPSSEDDFYTGMYIVNYNKLNISLYTSSSYNNISTKIIAYNGITKEATLQNEIDPSVGFFFCFVCDVSYDNAQSLIYSGQRNLSQQMCYMVQLLQLSVPSSVLTVGHGGRLTSYPYIYVHFYNENYPRSSFYSNNTGSFNCTFKVVIDGTSVIQNEDGSLFPWITFNNMGQSAPQAIKFSMIDSIRIKVTLPNGQSLDYTDDLTYPPPSVPNFQDRVSMLIALSRV